MYSTIQSKGSSGSSLKKIGRGILAMLLCAVFALQANAQNFVTGRVTD